MMRVANFPLIVEDIHEIYSNKLNRVNQLRNPIGTLQGIYRDIIETL